jgi:Kef-type K+ transport system membrane component KefB
MLPLLATADAEFQPLLLAAVLLSLAVCYIASKVGGEFCSRLNLPPVLGELLGGVVVGISALHLLVFPESGAIAADSQVISLLGLTAGLPPELAVPVFQSSSEVLSVLAEIGVIILLFEIGLKSNLNELIRVGPQAALVALTGVVVPFVAGTLGLMALFHVPAIAAIFAGAALTATSIGITAKVLAEVGQLKGTEGQIIIGAAVLDDILGIIVLAVVTGLAKTGEVDLLNVAIILGSSTLFVVGAILLGRVLGPQFVKLVNQLETRGVVLITALVLAVIVGYIAQVIRLEAILGSFAVGLVLGETEKKHDLQKDVAPIADVLVPLFFVTVGAKTDLSVLNPAVAANREGLAIALFLVATAVLGKLATALVVRGSDEQPLNRWAIGVGMIPRGEVGLVFAGVGAASGVLPDALNVAVVIMVIATTFLAPPLLRQVFTPHRRPDQRLRRSDRSGRPRRHRR